MILNTVVLVFLSLCSGGLQFKDKLFKFNVLIRFPPSIPKSYFSHVSDLPFMVSVAINFLKSHQQKFSNIFKGKKGPSCSASSHHSIGL